MVSNASVSVINKLLLILRTIRISFFGFGNFPSFMFNVCTLCRSSSNNTVKNLLQSKRNPQGRVPTLDYLEQKAMGLSARTNSHNTTPIKANTDPVANAGTQPKAEGSCPTEL